MAGAHRLEIADIGIAGNKHPVCRDRAAIGGNHDRRPLVLDLLSLRLFEQIGAGKGGLLCQPDEQFHRVDMPGAGVADAEVIAG
ncbi:hypothetical protein D9M72_550820 [compost metagenome]